MMLLKERQMLIGDIHNGSCRKPRYNETKKYLLLDGNASCEIQKETKEQEIKQITLEFRGLGFDKIRTKIGDLIKWRELSVINCTCSSQIQSKKIHDKHAGSGRTIPFPINRTDKPAVCMQVVRGEPELHAKIIATSQ